MNYAFWEQMHRVRLAIMHAQWQLLTARGFIHKINTK